LKQEIAVSISNIYWPGDWLYCLYPALATGIVVATKDTATQAVKHAYAGLKKVIQDRYAISLSNLEQKPNSEAQKSAVKEVLKEKNAHDDPELVDNEKTVVKTVEENDPTLQQTVESVGVDWVRVKVDILTIKSIQGGEGGTGLRATDSTIGRGTILVNSSDVYQNVVSLFKIYIMEIA
jgi:hypothetical protein